MLGFNKVQQFQPADGNSSVLLPCTTSSANVQLPLSGIGNVEVEVTNAGTVNVFLAFGDTAAAAATIPTGVPGNGYILLPGQTKVMGIGVISRGYIAGIAASATASVYITIGSGA